MRRILVADVGLALALALVAWAGSVVIAPRDVPTVELPGVVLSHPDWAEFRSARHGFAFEYPRAFDEHPRLELCRPLESGENVYVGTRISLAVSELREDLAALVDRRMASSVVEARRALTVAGEPAIDVRYRFARRGESVFFERTGRLYEFHLVVDTSLCDDVLAEPELFRHILATFRFVR